jgi:hypothetical protein
VVQVACHPGSARGSVARSVQVRFPGFGRDGALLQLAATGFLDSLTVVEAPLREYPPKQGPADQD